MAWTTGLLTSGSFAQASRDTIFAQTLSFPTRIGNGWIEAHWMENGSRFWYAEGESGHWTFYEYDPARKARATPVRHLTDAQRTGKDCRTRVAG